MKRVFKFSVQANDNPGTRKVQHVVAEGSQEAFAKASDFVESVNKGQIVADGHDPWDWQINYFRELGPVI